MLFWLGFQIRRLLNRLSKILGKMKLVDDFDWGGYTASDYGPQLEVMSKNSNLLVPSETKSIKDVTALNLNPEIAQLYSRILELDPNQILEVGAGAGSNLINLQTLLPKASCWGVELLHSQVELGKSLFGSRLPERNILIADFINDDVSSVGSYELVFTNAVAMHLTSKKAKALITKMLTHSRRYVLLHENLFQSHNFFQLMSQLDTSVDFTFSIEKPSKSVFGFVLLTKGA